MKKVVIITAAALVLLLAVITFTFKIKKVSVEGNMRYSAEEIEEKVLNDRWSYYSVITFIRTVSRKKESIPFVEDYKIVFNSPFDIKIIIYEKSIVAYVSYMSSYMYFDKDGIVVESSSEKLSGFPEVCGLEFGSIVLYRKLPVKDDRIFGNILNLTQELQIKNIKVSRIEYSFGGEATLYLADEDIIVELGNDSETSGKITELSDILPELRGMSGTLYLDSYSPDSAGTVYTFKRR